MANRLANQTSPYLQQHAANPVDWYPWGPEALERARREDKPILLSVGYSACHWCHVMAHARFEDPAVAALMNRLFVNVKVDREERPDLDQIYQSAHQMLAQRPGGWPLTMFLAPDGTPFFGGTYFPKAARFGLPGFAQLCERIAAIWRDQQPDIASQNSEMHKALARTLPRRAPPRVLAGFAARNARSAARRFRCPLRRLRRRAEVSASDRSRVVPAQGRDRHRAHHAQAHVRGRHLRSARRRLQPLQRRRAVDDPALREDALRQRAAARAARRRLAGHRRAGVRALRRGERRLDHARDAVARGRLLLLARRRQRARGGQVLRLEPRGSAIGAQ